EHSGTAVQRGLHRGRVYAESANSSYNCTGEACRLIYATSALVEDFAFSVLLLIPVLISNTVQVLVCRGPRRPRLESDAYVDLLTILMEV
ncbi:hypothetical protein EVAR_71191_1, partial [Eumeta japonica]